MTVLKIARFILFAFFSLCLLIYYPCNIYDFSPPEKFAGNFLYNPYKSASPDWQKSNFHAHAVAWGGVTNGTQQAQNILDAYRQHGYSWSSVSNYEDVAKEDMQPNSINVYEHGFNISKTHQLVIMPGKVCYGDFPFFQFTSSKQFVINKLNEQAKAVALAHPKLKSGYSDEDLKRITGYNLIEVLNHSGNAANKWDVALSAGKPVWIIGDDDTHDLNDSDGTFTNWTMVNCHQPNKDSLVNNLMNGNAYGVTGKNAFNDNAFVNIKIDSMSVSFQLQNNADSIKLIGQNGTERKLVYNTSKVNYTFLKTDTYIRAVAFNKTSTMFLNPVIRYNGSEQPQNISTATINSFNTILYRCSLAICWLVILAFLYQKKASRFIESLSNRLSPKNKLPSLYDT